MRLFKNMRVAEERFFYLLLLIFVAWKLCFVPFGFDLHDKGWELNFYQQIFAAPASVEYSFLYYLKGVVGGVWQWIIPGFVGERLLDILLSVVAFTVIYRMLKSVFCPYALAFGLFFCALFNGFHHCLPLLFAVIGIYFIVRGLVNGRWLPLAIGGFFLAIDTFTRLPAVVLLALGVLIPVFSLRTKEKFTVCVRKCVVFAAGAGAGYAAVFALMAVLGHLPVFFNAVASMRAVAESPDASHSLLILLANYCDFAGRAFFHSGAFSLVFAFSVFLFAQARRRSGIGLTLFVGLLSIALNAYVLCRLSPTILFGGYVYAILYFVPLVAFTLYFCAVDAAAGVDLHRGQEFLFVVAALGLLFLLPFGSDFVTNLMPLAACFAFPIGCAILKERFWGKVAVMFTGGGSHVFPLRSEARAAAFCAAVVFIGYFLGRCLLSQHAVDFGWVWAKRHTINNERARFIFTTEPMARNVNALLDALKQCGVTAGDMLLCHDSVPSVNYLTATCPFAKTSWVITYSADVYRVKLAEGERAARAAGKPLPLVVVERYDKIPRHLHLLRNPRRDVARDKVLADFLSRNHYRRRSVCDWFEIWQPHPVTSPSR